MRLLKNVLAAMLISLSISLTACTREVPVEVPVPAPTCNPGPIPVFPPLRAEKCVDGETELVCLTPQDAAAIWAWVKDMGRWAERAQICHDVQSLMFATPKLEGSPAPAVTRTELDGLAKDLSDPRVKWTIVYRKCGFENAFYKPWSREIEICTEMLEYPGVRFFLAHEIAHAYITQLDVPFTGSAEAAADELAAVLLIKSGHADAVGDGALYWLAQAEESNVPGWADHPDHDQRAWTLSCLFLETNPVAPLPAECRGDLQRVQRTWIRLLK